MRSRRSDRVLDLRGASGSWRAASCRMATGESCCGGWPTRGALLSTIVLLGEFDGQQWIDALQHGAFDVLVEPVAPRELARVVRRASRWTAGRLRAPILITEPSSSKRRKSVGLRTLWDRLHRRANGNG
ncbi:MAG: hypothetical protein R2762_29730 [Bryobacteraceae bacterium]